MSIKSRMRYAVIFNDPDWRYVIDNYNRVSPISQMKGSLSL